MPDSLEIADSELLYRKISVKSDWYDIDAKEVKLFAFNPRESDDSGISLDRAKSTEHPEFRSIEEAAQGRSSSGYFVAVLKVGKLRASGFTLVADSLPDNPGHLLLVDLTYGNHKDPKSKSKMLLLAHQLVQRVEGPFNSGGD